MNYPRFVEIDGVKYEINTDFRVGIECDRIARDSTIGDYERAMGILYVLFGDNAFKCNNKTKLLELAKRYLSCGKEIEEVKSKIDMDFQKDIDFIEASFMSDFHIDLEKTEMHWWKFINLMNGLSNSELGNCCVLNKIRNLRNMDLSKIKDDKTRQKIAELQRDFALEVEERKFTEEEKNAIDEFEKLMEEGD